MNGVWYNQHGQLAQFTGPPSTARSGGGLANFHTVFPSIEPPGTDGKIRIGADVKCWDEYTSGTMSTEWDGVAYKDYTVTNSVTQAEGEEPEGRRIFATNEIAYNLNAANGYGFTTFKLDDATVSHFSSFTMPRYTTALQGDAGRVQWDIKNDSFNIGQTLRGCSTYTSANGSVGALVQHQNSRDDSDASFLNTTRQCIFQYAHPAGVYFPATAAAWTTLFGSPVIDATTYDSQMKVRGRGLLDDTSKKFDLVLVARWDTHTAELKVKITSSLGNATYTLPNTGQTGATIDSDNLLVSADFLDFDPTGDELKIEVLTATDKAVEIKTLALFEAKD
jgi:hypothetical protein